MGYFDGFVNVETVNLHFGKANAFLKWHSEDVNWVFCFAHRHYTPTPRRAEM